MKKVKKKTSQKKGKDLNLGFKESLNYLKDLKIYLFISIGLILIASLFGYFGLVKLISPAIGKALDLYVAQSIEEVVRQTQGMGPIELTFFIMSNNIRTAFFGMLSGMYLAIAPVFISIFNGYVLGFVSYGAVNSPKNPLGIFVLWRLLPHGIFEIPAILISIALGIKMGLYPLFVKEKGKGLLSIILALFIFLILSSAIMMIISLFNGAGLSLAATPIESEMGLTKIMDNPFIAFIFYVLIGLSMIVSLLIGIMVLNSKDRKMVKDIMVNSFKVFLFVIVPFLVIAGIIEGLLIFFLG